MSFPVKCKLKIVLYHSSSDLHVLHVYQPVLMGTFLIIVFYQLQLSKY